MRSKGRNYIIISGVLVAFLAGAIFSSPNYALALPPWANEILERIGILETTTASLQTQIDTIELTPGTPGADGADGLSCENQLAISSQIQEFTPDPVCLGEVVCVDAVDCILPNVLEAQCSVGQCEIVQCEDGFVDVDQVTSNGCEELFTPPVGGTCSTQELTTLGNCAVICEGDGTCILACAQNAVPPISSECETAVTLLGICLIQNQQNGCLEGLLDFTPNQCIIDSCSSQWETLFGEPPTLPSICEGEPQGPAPSQIVGDCQVLECDGSGGEIVIVDDNDIPDDFNECTIDSCQNGIQIFANQPSETSCEQGQGVCDGNGQCVTQCGINETLCGDNVCVDLSTDVNNCGQCDAPCEGEQSCNAGICEFDTLCNDVDGDGLGDGTNGNVGCVDTTTDSNDADSFVCADTDADTCDDCSSGMFDPSNDGPDTNGNGVCDAGEIGLVKSWGSNFDGELGDGTTINRSTPVSVSGLSNAIAVSAGFGHSLALISGGTVVAWGDNFDGQLGDGTTTDSLTPVSVIGISTATDVAAGTSHSLALISGGTVVAWGDNTFGQLGDGTTTDSLTPIPVPGLTNVIAISVGDSHSLALISGGTVVAWGNNFNGQLGDGTTTDSLTPVSVSGLSNAIAVSAGLGHSLALISGGTVVAWGNNFNGQLGDGTTTDSLTPIPVSGISTATDVAAGAGHSLALISGGTVVAWGNNFVGQLGDGTTTDRLTPVSVIGITTAADIAAGFAHSLVT